MRIRYNPEARPALAACPFYVNEPMVHRGTWAQLFSEQRPLVLELGCGKGFFIANTAKADISRNYIAVDIKSEMLYLAMKNVEKAYHSDPVDNLRLADMQIMLIHDYFDTSDSIDTVIINFCNPWPKAKHQKRRLTHPNQLSQYRSFMKDGGNLIFRSDDAELFEDTQEYLASSGFEIIDIRTYSSPDSPKRPDMVMTEHEKMFLDMGKTIGYINAVKK